MENAGIRAGAQWGTMEETGKLQTRITKQTRSALKRGQKWGTMEETGKLQTLNINI